ncbi:MAG: acyltransferase, partial [Candidatus Obscuribacterales bacterium]|nr:acyltransferase [Candidatus Obscuribacterales bacterium]
MSVSVLKPKSQEFAAEKSSDKAGSQHFGYIPALDGLRAISILLVLAFHDIGPITSQIGHAYSGWIGVDVFFVISGYLITSILLKEASANNGEFSLRKFYIRRWLRIAPAYYAFLAVALGWYCWGGNHHLKPFLCAALYLTNLDLAYGWNLIPLKVGLSHLWSLGLEEQFYLVWPASM